MKIETQPLTDRRFGVRIRGISGESLKDPDVGKQLRGLLAEHGLMIIDDCASDHRVQVEIARQFGPVKDYPPGERVIAGDEEIPGVGEMNSGPTNSTIVEIDGKQLSGWMPWHFDQPYNARPNAARVLRCGRQVTSGGMTGFLDGAELYERLDPALREAVRPSSIRYGLNLALEDLRFGLPSDFRVIRSPQRALSGAPVGTLQTAAQPAVIESASGRKILLVSPWMAIGVVGRPGPDGDALLEAVAQEILMLSRKLAYFHDWSLSEMLVWDNRRMLHSSTGFPPGETRIMYRTTIKAN